MDHDEFADLLRRAVDGEVTAASELLKRYQPQIQRMIRSKLPKRMRSKFDSMDFVQAVWKSVLSKEKETEAEAAPRFEGESHFKRYVSVMARNKVLEQYRRHTQTGKYNIALEEPLYITRGTQRVPRELAAVDPSPSEDAQAADLLARILKGRSELERDVIMYKRQGMTYIEIAEKTGIGEASARRIIEAFRKREENRGWE